MSSRWPLIIIGAFIIASLGGVGFLVYRSMTDSIRCAVDDERICNLLNNIQKKDVTDATGSFIKTTGDGNQTEYIWKIEDTKTEISVHNDGKEILHVIADRDSIFIQIPKESKWISQKRKTPIEIEKALPFQIKSYFDDLKSVILDPHNSYTYIDSTQCKNERCYRYLLTSPQNEERTIQRYIYITRNGDLKAYHYAAYDDKEEFTLDTSTSQIVLPKQSEHVDSNRNMILEIMTKANDNTIFEYVKDFEKQRRANEGDTPTPKPSLELTP